MYSSALVDLGALICVPRKPKCAVCPVKKFCRAENPAALPIKQPRPRANRITENHAFVLQRGRILLEQSRRRWRRMCVLPRLKLNSLKQARLRRRMYETVFPYTNHRADVQVHAQDRP